MNYIVRQIMHVYRGGYSVLARKIRRLVSIVCKFPLYAIFAPFVLLMRALRPWCLLRLGELSSSRIGHFAANTELYLCEIDAGINRPSGRYVDIFFYQKGNVCNKQLSIMWNRVLRIWPSWIMRGFFRVNQLIPGGGIHEVGNNSQHDRDVYNLFDKYPPHIKFSEEEEARGLAGLRAMGLSSDSKFVCLLVRDGAYLDAVIKGDWSYHNFRDSDIDNYVMCAEMLAKRGYYVFRMGAKVHHPLMSNHPMIIDYATNGMRDDFMDIYLGAKCSFCLSTSSGWDAVPIIFRRPIAYVNMVPIGYMISFLDKSLTICKRYFYMQTNRELTISEIFCADVGFLLRSDSYFSKGIRLLENSPEEICGLATEMVDRIEGTYVSSEEDEVLQEKFWELFLTSVKGASRGELHGKILARYGMAYLRDNKWWVQ